MAAMTLRLDEEDNERLRRRADDEGRSMQQVMHDALREYLDRHATMSWAEMANRPPLFKGTRAQFDALLRESDRDRAGEEDD